MNNSAREQRPTQENSGPTVRREILEKEAIAKTPARWPKVQCIRVVNNFIRESDIFADTRDVDFGTLMLVSSRLADCAKNYAWTFEERNLLAIPIPFTKIADQERQMLTQMMNVRIINFIRERGLVQKFGLEIGHNTIVLDDSLGFLTRHGLTTDFIKNDDSQSDQYRRSEATSVATHRKALLLGVEVPDVH